MLFHFFSSFSYLIFWSVNKCLTLGFHTTQFPYSQPIPVELPQLRPWDWGHIKSLQITTLNSHSNNATMLFTDPGFEAWKGDCRINMCCSGIDCDWCASWNACFGWKIAFSPDSPFVTSAWMVTKMFWIFYQKKLFWIISCSFLYPVEIFFGIQI